ncbi:DivIVA domain-containing protein [Nonomuraea sp. NPDC049152]|uniref:DivIVA domain-containing protein n=1 Tax=Nonomuraea sp. NPDC049152 TaxID=3154350 RepID=UPI0033C48501
MRGEGGIARGDLPQVQIVHLDHVLVRGGLGAELHDPEHAHPAGVGTAHQAAPGHAAAGAGNWTLLTPAEVQQQVFTAVRLREGYDLTEVDEFLSRVQTTLGLLWRDNAHLREQLAAALATQPAPRPSDARVAAAHRAAEGIVAAARRQSEEILAAAHDQAEPVRRDAAQADGAMLDDARLPTRQAIEDQIDQINAAVAEHGRQLHRSLHDYLAQIRRLQADLTPPRPAPSDSSRLAASGSGAPSADAPT